MKIDFTKMHGCGNDYIYVDCTAGEIPSPEKVAVAVSDRHFGIGADGLILICASESCDFRMRMFNADGSEGKMCGNGVRCVAKYVYERGLTDKREITLETLGGIKTLRLDVRDGVVESVEVDMGEPVFDTALIPMRCSEEQFIDKNYVVGGRAYTATAVSMGNPHCVIFTKDIGRLDLERIGPDFERAEAFPEGVNTEFVEVLGKSVLKMRVWERGSGETLACGTGACASVAAACLHGAAERGREVRVVLKGGELSIVWRNDGHIIMRGPAAFICDGTTEVEV